MEDLIYEIALVAYGYVETLLPGNSLRNRIFPSRVTTVRITLSDFSDLLSWAYSNTASGMLVELNERLSH